MGRIGPRLSAITKNCFLQSLFDKLHSLLSFQYSHYPGQRKAKKQYKKKAKCSGVARIKLPKLQLFRAGAFGDIF
jgi:hypothetical protein